MLSHRYKILVVLEVAWDLYSIHTDLLLFVDIILLIGLLYFKVIKMDVQDMARRKFVAVLSLALGVSCLNLG